MDNEKVDSELLEEASELAEKYASKNDFEKLPKHVIENIFVDGYISATLTANDTEKDSARLVRLMRWLYG